MKKYLILLILISGCITRPLTLTTKDDGLIACCGGTIAGSLEEVDTFYHGIHYEAEYQRMLDTLLSVIGKPTIYIPDEQLMDDWLYEKKRLQQQSQYDTIPQLDPTTEIYIAEQCDDTCYGINWYPKDSSFEVFGDTMQVIKMLWYLNMKNRKEIDSLDLIK